VAENVSGEAIYADCIESERTRFIHNIVNDSAKNGFNTNNVTMRHVEISFNSVSKVSGAAVLVASDDAQIENNMISCGTSAIGADIIGVAPARRYVVEGNVISGCNTSRASVSPIHLGLHSSGIMAGTGVVAGNVIRNNVTANERIGGAIYIDDQPGPIIIMGNVIVNNGRCCFGGSPAISIGNATGKVLIEGNQIRGSTQRQSIGVRVERSAARTARILLRWNMIEEPVDTRYEGIPSRARIRDFARLLEQAGGSRERVAHRDASFSGAMAGSSRDAVGAQR
jgi:hypothetical protein